MMQLLTTVQKDNMILSLEKISLYLSIIASLLCLFLYGNHTGFLKGENYAISAYTTTALTKSFNDVFSEVPNDYEIISKSYLFVFALLLAILVTHLVGKGVLSKCMNLFLLCLPVFEYWQIFKLKQLAVRYHDSPRFDLFRQTVFLDIIGAIAIVSLLVIQIILVFLILKKQKKDKLAL